VAGVFHLASHAIFKALLFMAAGAVIHACESTNMFDMGGIRREMPITFATMLVGALSLSGIPPLSGFWSKEAVFTACMVSGQYVLLALAAVTAAITFFYSIRMIAVTFLGSKSEHLEALEHEGHHVHEVSKVMWVPYTILAVATVILGFVGPLFEGFMHGFLEPSMHILHHEVRLSTMIYGSVESYSGIPVQLITTTITACMLVIGGLPAYYLYVSRRVDPGEFVEKHGLKGLYNFLYNRWYINSAYYRIFIYSLISGCSLLFRKFEKPILDGLNYMIAHAFTSFSQAFRKIQTGVSSFNIMGMALGMALLIILVALGIL